MSDPTVRRKLENGAFFVVPGVQDMIAAVIADKVGFDVVYGTGFWVTASAYGLPDAGIASYTQMLDRMATIARTTKAALIADADTGYGGLLNVHHTVRGYEAAGVSVIQLEDQEFPKKCGHTPHKRLVSKDEMVEKIKVACDARIDKENTLIIARTDARQGEGMDGVLRRLEAYDKAGADILFPEALHSEEEMRAAAAGFAKPVMANMSNAGAGPAPSAAVLEELGYAFAIYPSLTSLAAAASMERVLRELVQTGSGNCEGLFDFREFCSLIGFEDVWAFDRKWSQI
jgi:2-methylisocitrate lyase-like PEP mutase family enzyme